MSRGVGRVRRVLTWVMPIGSLIAFAVVVVLWVATSLVLRHSLTESGPEVRRPAG